MNIPGKQKLQGTDGIRRETKRSHISDCKGLTPQQVFLEKNWVTEQFMELYAYSCTKKLISELWLPHHITQMIRME